MMRSSSIGPDLRLMKLSSHQVQPRAADLYLVLNSMADLDFVMQATSLIYLTTTQVSFVAGGQCAEVCNVLKSNTN
jgi:hypothetical protein